MRYISVAEAAKKCGYYGVRPHSNTNFVEDIICVA